MSKISIALCTYNGANFLPEQLRSFPQQTRPPDDLIVCDDHEARKNLPSKKMKRISPIIKELSIGRYNRFSKGFISPVKDLFENW